MATHSLGIDFGTSTTLIAVAQGRGAPRVLPIGESTPWMPSVAGLTPEGELVVGEVALLLDPRRQIRSIKARVTDGVEQVEVDGEAIDARAVMKALLAEALTRARKMMPKLLDTSKVYLGCPALWNGQQRRLLADVVHELGIDVDVADIIDEPVAAGLHAVHTQILSGGAALTGKTVIFDAGGGTLDVAYLDVKRDKADEFTVLSAEGINVSGDAVDHSIAEHLMPVIAEVEDQQLADLLLRVRSRSLKEGLSRELRRVEPLGGGFDILLELTRPKLEELIEPQLARSLNLTKSAVRGSLLRVQQVLAPDEIRKLPWPELSSAIHHVVLVGGLSQMPVVAARLSEEFPGAAVTLVESPQESVALGLAMGDRLNRLNLPRPPVNFVVEFGPQETIERFGLEQWAEQHRRVYDAFSPLYEWSELMKGHTYLGYKFTIPFPPGVNVELQCRISGESPDRARTPLPFKVSQRDDEGVLTRTKATSIVTGHSHRRPVTFSLYTNGDLLITGARGEIFKFRVQRWPVLRGPTHDFQREVELEHLSSEPYGSQLRYDNWRFN